MHRPLILIPARWASSRFPGKPLALINGVPLILRVCARASQAFGVDSVRVITDDNRINKTVIDAGFVSIMRDCDAATGTDRLADAVSNLEGDIFINVQGDEPLVCPEDIRRIYTEKVRNPHTVINGYCEITDPNAIRSLSTPKVVFDENSRLLYMSRSVVPGSKVGQLSVNVGIRFFRQVCIYAYNRAELQFFSQTERTAVEQNEDIEVLRFLMAGKPVLMVECEPTECAVDTPEDVIRVERLLTEPGARR